MTERTLLAMLLTCLALTACVGSQPQQASTDSIARTQANGVTRYNEGDYRGALQAFANALHEYRAVDDADGIITSSINIARSHHAAGSPQDARRWADQAAALLRELDVGKREILEANMALLSADIHIDAGDYDAAGRILEPLLDNADASLRAHALKQRTEIAFATASGEREALAAYRAAIASLPPTAAHHARVARFEAALTTQPGAQDRHFATALSVYRELRNKRALAATLQEWASAMLARGEFAAAEQRLLRALYIRAAIRDVASTRVVMNKLGELYRDAAGLSAQRAAAVPYWLQELERPGFALWPNLIADFDSFPR